MFCNLFLSLLLQSTIILTFLTTAQVESANFFLIPEKSLYISM
ncbi:hypothetical protein HHE014_06130 [Helicobacter heilmannii]|nr:hypothetical protein HHE014_06130 [Helicobacter heilmannii]